MQLIRLIKRSTILSNYYLYIGILVGILSTLTIFESSPNCDEDNTNIDWSITNEPIKSNTSPPKGTISKPSSFPNNRVVGNNPPIRPRYYSTELGIREKLLVGVLTSVDRLDTHAVPLNVTLERHVDKIKFFIGARQMVGSTGGVKYAGLVGFTDTRHRFRPFQIIKYLVDNLPDYDYYYLVNDFSYVNGQRLKERLSKISVGVDVYLGTPVNDASYCDLDAGIAISNSVLKLMKDNIDWCVMNAASDFHSENIGRCIYHSTNLECQRSVQGQAINSFKLKQNHLTDNLAKLSELSEFDNAVSVYPVLEQRNFHILHTYFSKRRLVQLQSLVAQLSVGLTEWPAGRRTGSKPATRFDLPKEHYFNMTHMFFPDDYTNIRKHTESDLNDIQQVLEAVRAKALYGNEANFQFRRLINGYRTFQLSRGMDYRLDLGFRDLHTGKELIKRFEICKPLGNVALIPAPYVTENVRVVIILPIEECHVDETLHFFQSYSKNIMEKREKAFLMLALLYQSNTTSKGSDDPFNEIKNLAVKYSTRINSEDTKIGWVSIRLPAIHDSVVRLRENRVLNFAIVDLALKKIGLDSLILVLDPFAEITFEFLNRVRMNTILNYQIFSVIPFRQFNPNISNTVSMDINKNTGEFDREEYKFIAFYARDYVNSRKLFQRVVPLIRVDVDIAAILHRSYRHLGNVLEMFVRHPGDVHCFRATDMSLKLRYNNLQLDNDTDVDVDAVDRRTNLFLGSKMQLGELILNNLDKMKGV